MRIIITCIDLMKMRRECKSRQLVGGCEKCKYDPVCFLVKKFTGLTPELLSDADIDAVTEIDFETE